MTSNASAVGQLDIGAPDPEVVEIMRLINAYADRPCNSADENIARVRGARWIRATAEDAWRRSMASAYYAPDGNHLSLATIGELNAESKPMARSTVQHHVGVGMELLQGEAFAVADRERQARAALVHGRVSAAKKSRRNSAA